MADARENVAALRRAFQRWHDTKGASVEDWMELLDDDVVVRSPGGHAAGADFTGGRSGRDEARRYFAGLTQAWELVAYQAEDFIAEGDRVVVLSRIEFRHRGTGRSVRSLKADVARFRDGKVVEFTEFFDTAAAALAADDR